MYIFNVNYAYLHVNVLFQADLVFSLSFENSPILSVSLFDIELSEAITVLESQNTSSLVTEERENFCLC